MVPGPRRLHVVVVDAVALHGLGSGHGRERSPVQGAVIRGARSQSRSTDNRLLLDPRQAVDAVVGLSPAAVAGWQVPQLQLFLL